MLIGGYGSAGTLADEVVAIQNKVPFIITGHQMILSQEEDHKATMAASDQPAPTA